MKISTKGRYGLRVMLELALQYGRGPVLAETIASNQAISGKYIHVLVTTLRTAGLVRAARGRNGGYELAREPRSITALDIVSALEGDCEPVACVGSPSACERSEQCVTRTLWSDVAQSISRTLANYSLEKLARMQREMQREAIDFEI